MQKEGGEGLTATGARFTMSAVIVLFGATPPPPPQVDIQKMVCKQLRKCAGTGEERLS